MNRLVLTGIAIRLAHAPHIHTRPPEDARLDNGVEATRWSREAKLSSSGFQVLTLFIYICK